MLESFSIQAVTIIEKAKEYASTMESTIVGSEHLLLALYNTPDSICHFLFSELNIKEENILKAMSKMEVIHKPIDKSIFSSKFVEIIENATLVSKDVKSDYVYDEHLFYSLLEISDSVAYEIINNLNIDIEEMLYDIEEIFNFYEDDNTSNKNPFPFLRLIKKEDFSHEYIHCKDYIEEIIYILKKKQKNNPLLIGNAGVGKTALIEGLVTKLKEEKIYELDLGGIVAGTKYRGELEDKLIKALEYVKEKNAIVFVDEIHNIVGAGSNEGSLDVANILKPYLTKTSMRFIGATTLDEYYRYINKDKALTRRFQNIYIEEPSKEETLKIIKLIKKHYEEYHHVFYPINTLIDIINKCDLYIPNRSFPDKAIDVLDEVGAIACLNKSLKVNKYVDKVIQSISGIKPLSLKKIKKLKLNYQELLPYYCLFITRDKNVRNIANISVNSAFKMESLLKDLYQVFNVKNECFLEIDLSTYTESTSLSNLVGTSKGYVGYEDGGILLDHILKYPLSIIFFKNYNDACNAVQNYLSKLVKKAFVIDNKGRKVFFSNTIFIFDQIKNKSHSLGFDNNKKQQDNNFIDLVLSDLKDSKTLKCL